MLLTRAADRLKAKLLELYPDVTIAVSGPVAPIRPRGEQETGLWEYGVDGNKISLNDTPDIQFIIRGLDGNFDPVLTGGTGQNYNQRTNLVLIAYAKDQAILERLQPALTLVKELRLGNFTAEPQLVASRYLVLQQDFNFKRPLIAIELTYTEFAIGQHCIPLPTEVCAPVEIVRDGELVQTVPSGGAYLYTTDCPECPECPPGGTVTITDQNGGTVAEVEAPGSYPVFVFDTIQNSLTSDGVIVNTI